MCSIGNFIYDLALDKLHIEQWDSIYAMENQKQLFFQQSQIEIQIKKKIL